jgi:hypothetical protein
MAIATACGFDLLSRAANWRSRAVLSAYLLDFLLLACGRHVSPRLSQITAMMCRPWSKEATAEPPPFPDKQRLRYRNTGIPFSSHKAAVTAALK